MIKKKMQREFYNSYCEDYDSIEMEVVNGKENRRRQRIVKRRAEIMAKLANLNFDSNYSNILEIGCGSGIYTTQLTKYAKEIYGLDISRGMLKKAKFKFNDTEVTFIEADAEHLPFKKDCFDAVVSVNSFEHLDDTFLALKEMKRVVKKGGRIVVSIPNANCMYNYKIIQFFSKLIANTSSYFLREKNKLPRPRRYDKGLTHKDITIDELHHLFKEIGINQTNVLFMGFIPHEIPEKIATHWLVETLEKMLEKIPIIKSGAGVTILSGSKQ